MRNRAPTPWFQESSDPEPQLQLRLLARTAPTREYDPYVDTSYLPMDYVVATLTAAHHLNRMVDLEWTMIDVNPYSGSTWPVLHTDTVRVFEVDVARGQVAIPSAKYNMFYELPFTSICGIKIAAS